MAKSHSRRRRPPTSFGATWAALRPGDVGRTIRIPDRCAKLFFAGRGEFDGARLVLEGSSDRRSWRIVNLVPVGPGKLLAGKVRRWVRPLVVGGGADTCIHARLVARMEGC